SRAIRSEKVPIQAGRPGTHSGQSSSSSSIVY
ncbi:MAG: hypothetical protein ACI868_000738, partial [Granulosicoccus sp.]